jgi:hypothetical protein
VKRIGELLIARGVDPLNLSRALSDQPMTRHRVCSLLISRGLLELDDASRALAEQHGCAGALTKHLDGRDPAVAALLPASIAIPHQALPLGRTRNNELIICVRDPRPELHGALERAIRQRVLLAVAPASRLQELVADTYGGTPTAEESVEVNFEGTGPIATIPEPGPELGGGFGDGPMQLVDLDDARVAKDHTQSGAFLMPSADRQHRASGSPVSTTVPPFAPSHTPPPFTAAIAPPTSPPVTPASVLAPPSSPPVTPASVLAPPTQPPTQPPVHPPTQPPAPQPSAIAPATRPPRAYPRPDSGIGLGAAGPSSAGVAVPQFDGSGDPIDLGAAGAGTAHTHRRHDADEVYELPDRPAPRPQTPSGSMPVVHAAPPGLDDAVARFDRAATLDDATNVAAAVLEQRFVASLIVMIRDGVALGQRGHGAGVHPVDAFAIPVGSPSLIKSAIDARRLTTDAPWGVNQNRLARALGSPRTPAAAPIIVNARVISVIAVGDPLRGDLEDARELVEWLAQALAAAYARLARGRP